MYSNENIVSVILTLHLLQANNGVGISKIKGKR